MITLKKVNFFLIFFLNVLVWLPRGEARDFKRSQLLMGDISVSLTITASSAKKERAYQAMEHAFAEAKKIEGEVSEWKPASQTSFLNQKGSLGWVPVGRNLRDLLIFSKKISELTEGAFDVTFASKNRRVSYRDILIFREFSLVHFARSGMRIGVSGIAKGFIVDRMSDILRQSGFSKFLVDAGDIFVSGTRIIFLRDPKNPEGTLCQWSVRDRAVSTSGNYARGVHLIAPKTKKPSHNFQSVTVIARKSILADTLAKGFFILGQDEISDVEKKISNNFDIGLITVNRQGVVRVSGKFAAGGCE